MEHPEPLNADEELDKLIESLPHYSIPLSKIKQCYSQILSQLPAAHGPSPPTTDARAVNRLHKRSTRYYRKYCDDLRGKLHVLKEETNQLQQDLRHTHTQETEILTKVKELKRQRELDAESVLSSNQKMVPLSPSKAADAAALKEQLVKAEQEYVEAKKTLRRKFVPKQRMVDLQKQLKDKEDLLAELTSSNRQLVVQCIQLKGALQASQLYCSSSHQDVDLETFITRSMDKKSRVQQLLPFSHLMSTNQIAVTLNLGGAGKQEVDEEEVEALLQEESSEDTAQEEREAEIMLDCIEKFEELFHRKHYEEAALVAANATKGVLRIPEVLTKFTAALPSEDLKSQSPAMLYINALVSSVDAFGPLQPNLGNLCAQVVLKEGEVLTLSSWIARGKFVVTPDLGRLILESCPCLKASPISCGCICPGLAHRVFAECGDTVQAVISLAREGKILNVLDFASHHQLTKQDYASVLYHCPSLDLAKAMVSPLNAKLTLFEATNILVMKEGVSTGFHLLKEAPTVVAPSGGDDFVTNIEHLVTVDTETSFRVWKSLANAFTNIAEENIALLGKTFLYKSQQ